VFIIVFSGFSSLASY